MKLLKYYNLKSSIILITILLSTLSYSQKKTDLSVNQISMLSALCPGLGQVYNQKYWKVPIIYAALGGAIYYYDYHQKQYNNYKNAYISETDSDISTINNSGYSASNLITLQDYYRNSRDLAGLLFILTYVLNIIDASVDAHLINYNVNDNLSFYIKPNKNQYSDSIHLCFSLNL